MNERLRTVLRFLYTPAAITFLIAFFVNLFIAWFNFSTYRIWNFDLAWQTQVVASYAEFREPTVPMIGDDYKALGNHFSPILALAAPIYALFPQSFTLNVLMAICFALAAAIFANCASKFTSRGTSYVLGIGLAISWGFITASSAGFHEYALGAPILAYALAKFIEGNFLRASLVAGFLVFVKEDVGLLLIGLGIVMAIRAKAWKWLLLSVWGAFWVVFTIKFFIPAISGDWEFTGFVTVDTQTLFTDFKFKVVLIAFLVLQGGLIGLRSPLAYILIPFLGARLFTAWSAFYILGYHYDTLTIIIASYALLDSLMRYEWRPIIKKMAVMIPIVTSVIYLTVPTPGNNTSWLTRDYSKDEQAIHAYESAFEAVPKGAIVAADDATVAGFFDRGYRTYHMRSAEGVERADCLVNKDSTIFAADGSEASSIEEIAKQTQKNYELRYTSDYIKVWCAELENADR